MNRMFQSITLGRLNLVNRAVFPPIKTGYGGADGAVTQRQLIFYRQIAANGPGLVILEPVSVSLEGKEHPKQLCVHLPQSAAELARIVEVVHGEDRLVCLHLNHAGAAANPKAAGTKPKAPSSVTCPASGQVYEPLTEQEIKIIIAAYGSAAEKAKAAGFDMIEVQAGHGYLVSQFLNRKINKRPDRYGEDRTLFGRQVWSVVREGAPDIPCILRISGNEMSPDLGLDQEDLRPILEAAHEAGIAAIHVGMGNACFSPPWYFHHMSLQEKPQITALSWVRQQTILPIIVAGRMGEAERIKNILDAGLADLVALGRPLIADPDLLEKRRKGADEDVRHCGYCLQGCLQRVKSGEGLGCNINPLIGQPELEPAPHALKVLVAGGGPAGMCAALYLAGRGHCVTLVEQADCLGGQFCLAWRTPGKATMKRTLDSLERAVTASGASIILGRTVDLNLVKEIRPDLLVWSVGASPNVPEIPGLDTQWGITAVEFLNGAKNVRGPRILVIGAGRVGVEIAELLGQEGYEVVATKRTDSIGSHMETITRNLALKRIGNMPNVTFMPRTVVKEFRTDAVEVEEDGVRAFLEPFQTVVVSTGLLSAQGPAEEIRKEVSKVEIIGDALEVQDIYSATQAGYRVALGY
ncbi:MAG: FAD-dependent oxidoreductase [Desulfomonilaceae bacterium]